MSSDFFGLIFRLYKYFVANKEPIKRAMPTTVRGSNCRYRAKKKDEIAKTTIKMPSLKGFELVLFIFSDLV